MLRRLLKHEFRATARIMLPLYLVVLLTAIGANLSIRFGMNDTENALVSLLSGFALLAFVLALCSVCIIAAALMVRRFYQNLLGDEGYVMFTLPVSVHQHICSKLIVSSVWFAATALVAALSLLILVFRVSLVANVMDVISFLQRQFELFPAFNSTAVAAEITVPALLSCAVTCLQCYAAMAIGHSFSSHRILLSVVSYFVLQFAMQTVASLLAMGSVPMLANSLLGMTPDWPASADATGYFHITMLLSAAASVLQGAVYYFLTAFMLKRHLNLE